MKIRNDLPLTVLLPDALALSRADVLEATNAPFGTAGAAKRQPRPLSETEYSS